MSSHFVLANRNGSYILWKYPWLHDVTWCLAASLLCVSRTENFLSLEANQILEAAPGPGVFGNFKFETLLTPSFHVIDRKSVLLLPGCLAGAPCQIPGSIKQKLRCSQETFFIFLGKLAAVSRESFNAVCFSNLSINVLKAASTNILIFQTIKQTCYKC